MADFKKHLRSTKVVKPFNELNEDEMIALLQTIFEQAGAPIRYIAAG